MKQLWNRQNKLNKFIAFCLALVLAIVPLMTYVGDKEGAKAEGGSTTVSEYNFKLEEDTDDNGNGLEMDIDKYGYYMQFKSDGSFEEQTISYYTDEVKFSVKATLTEKSHIYRNAADKTSDAKFDPENYDISYVPYTSELPNNAPSFVSKITATNGYVTVNSTTSYPNGIAVYIKPTISETPVESENTIFDVKTLQDKMGYTLIGVYKFEKKTLAPVWIGNRRGISNETVNNITQNNTYSSATLSVDAASDAAGTIKYKVICSDIAPDPAAIEDSYGWSETPAKLGSDNASGTYYGYAGYFIKDAGGVERLVTYGGTSTPIKLDTVAPVVTNFDVSVKDISSDYIKVTSSDLDEAGVYWLSNPIKNMNTAYLNAELEVQDADASKVEFKAKNLLVSTDQQTPDGDKVKYYLKGCQIPEEGWQVEITATDSAGNVTEAVFKIDGNPVKFKYGNIDFMKITSAGIVGSADNGNVVRYMSANTETSTTYINKKWLTTHGTPSFVIKTESYKPVVKSDSYNHNNGEYIYRLSGLNDDEINTSVSEFVRPYYYTSIINNLGDTSTIYNGVNIFYKWCADSQYENTVNYGTIICDYDEPVINAAKLQRTNAGGVWEDVPASDIENNQYYINPKETTQYRYYVDASDVGSGIADTGVVCDNSLYTFAQLTEAGDTGYVCYITPSTLPETIADANPVNVKVTDKAGNVSTTKKLPTLIKQTGATTISPKLLDKGKLVDVSDTTLLTQYTTKNTLTLKVDVSSGVDITDVSFTANVNGVPTTFAATRISNTHQIDSKLKVYKATYEFTIPANSDINSIIANGSINVTTDDAVYNASKPLRTILYDSTIPVFKATVGSTVCYLNQVNVGWQQSYDLNYTILSGEDANVESAIASAAYTVDNTKPEDVRTNEAILVNGTDKSVSGVMAIPESATIDGTRVAITATDVAGNAALNGANQQVYIKVDKTKPSIGGVSVTGYSVHSVPIAGYPNVSAVISDNLTLQSAEMKITYPNGEVKTATLSAKEQTGLSELISYQIADGAPDGDYRVEINAKDMAGNDAVTKVTTFKLDNTKPVVTAAITSGTVGGKATRADGTDMYYRSDVGVTFTCSDENIKGITVTDNDSPVEVHWSAATGTIIVSGEGRHVIKINAVDISGNKADDKSVEFIIDKSAPVISLALNGLPYQESRGVVDCSGDSTVGVTVSDLTVDASDFYYQVAITRPDQQTITSEYLQTQNRSFTFSDEGDYTMNFYTLDMANNQSATRSVSFRIDKTAPEVSISGTAGGGTSANSANVSFILKEAFWRDASGVITIYRKAGDGSEETLYKTINVTPTAYETVTTESLTETGVYRMEFTATDRIGHKSSTNQTFTIDREAPVVTLTGVNNYDVTDKTVEFKAEVNDDFYSSKTVSIEGTRTDMNGKKNTLSFSSFNQHGNPTVINESYADDGIYDITVTATDAAGNKHSSTVHFTIDKTAPVITGLDDLDGRILTAVDLDFDLDEMVSDLTVCEIHMYLNGSEYDGVSDIEDGSYTLLVTAEDELGHYSEKSVSFVLDTKPPVFIVTGVEDGEVKQADYSIDVSLQLDEDKLTEVTLNGKAIDISEDSAHIDVTKEGNYTLYMKAVDVAGNEAEQTIEFKYGKDVNVLLIVIIIIVAVLLIGGVIFFIIAKRKKK